MQNDPDALTTDSIELTVAGEVYVEYPPGSYPAQPDQLLFLDDILAKALEDCGLTARVQDVAKACRKHAIGHFVKEAERLETVRKKLLSEDGM